MDSLRQVVNGINVILGRAIGSISDSDPSELEAKISQCFERVKLVIESTRDVNEVSRLYKALTSLQAELPLDAGTNQAYKELGAVLRLAETKLTSSGFFDSLDQVLDNPTFFRTKTLRFNEEKKEFYQHESPATLEEKNFFFEYCFKTLSNLPKNDDSNKKLISLAKTLLDLHKADPKIDLSSLYSSRPILLVRAQNSAEETSEVPLTAGAIARSRFLESLENYEDSFSIPYPAKKLENYLNYIQKLVSDDLSEEELLDLMNTAYYLQDDELIKSILSIFSVLGTKLENLSKDRCFALIRCMVSNRQSFGIMQLEQALMSRLNTIIMTYSDDDILKVFQDLGKYLGDLKENVRFLNLKRTQVSSNTLRALDELFPNLEKLDISQTRVTEIPYGPWKNLQKLVARDCGQLTSIDALKDTGIKGPTGIKLTGVKEIDISGSRVVNILYGPWEKLEILLAQGCKELTFIDGLAQTGIKKIDVSGSKVAKIPFGPWENLEELAAEQCKQLISIDGLQHTGIKKIGILYSGVKEIPFGPWEKLEILFAQGCKELTSIDALKDTGIKKIRISHSGVKEIPFGSWEKLETLFAEGCSLINSIDALKDTGIEEIHVSESGVTQIASGPNLWKKLKILQPIDLYRQIERWRG